MKKIAFLILFVCSSTFGMQIKNENQPKKRDEMYCIGSSLGVLFAGIMGTSFTGNNLFVVAGTFLHFFIKVIADKETYEEKMAKQSDANVELGIRSLQYEQELVNKKQEKDNNVKANIRRPIK